jgi:hypothetical protein
MKSFILFGSYIKAFNWYYLLIPITLSGLWLMAWNLPSIKGFYEGYFSVLETKTFSNITVQNIHRYSAAFFLLFCSFNYIKYIRAFLNESKDFSSVGVIFIILYFCTTIGTYVTGIVIPWNNLILPQNVQVPMLPEFYIIGSGLKST